MLIEGLIIGLLLSLMFNGKIKNLKKIHFKHFNLLVAAFLFRTIAVQIGFGTLTHNVLIGRLINVMSLITLLWVVFENKELPGMKIFMAGVLLNLLVISVNGGSMPVHEDLAVYLEIEKYLGPKYITHKPMGDRTYLNFLGDIIPIIYPRGWSKIISLGDVLLSLGIIKTIYQSSGAKRLSFSSQSAKIE